MNRDYNRLEVVKLKAIYKNEEDIDKRTFLLEKIVFGEDLIKTQTCQIKALSIQRIADEVNAPMDAVVYYQKSSSANMVRL